VKPLIIAALLLGAPAARADRVDDLGRVLLTDSNWKVRMQAASVLGRLHDKRGVPALVRALSDASETVRGVAAGVLGDMGDPSAVPALQRSLRDPSQVVRDQAETALALLVPPSRVAAPAPSSRNGVRVELGAITSRTSQLPDDLAAKLRAAVTRSLAATPGIAVGAAGKGAYVLDTSVTKLQRRKTEEFVEVTCEVSLILGRLPDKSIVMTTSGSATSHAPTITVDDTEERALVVDALEGALGGAYPNLEAFFKTQARR
jgi:hypothetical protein